MPPYQAVQGERYHSCSFNEVSACLFMQWCQQDSFLFVTTFIKVISWIPNTCQYWLVRIYSFFFLSLQTPLQLLFPVGALLEGLSLDNWSFSIWPLKLFEKYSWEFHTWIICFLITVTPHNSWFLLVCTPNVISSFFMCIAFFFFFVCSPHACRCLWAVEKEGTRFARPGVTGICELRDVGARTWT